MENIIQQVLGNNSFYADAYIKDSINFVKSIVFVNGNEAKSYNDLIAIRYPNFIVSDQKPLWRYYKHLIGELHELDVPVMAVSVDNGTTIQLTRATLAIHRKTRNEILKFGLYYDELVKKYPEQELYIRGITLDQIYTNIHEIIALEDFTVISCNSVYIEENEDDLLKDLQTRINNYKSIWLLPYYALLDNLFLASQYHIFYNFLLTSILAIRLQNDKTMRAHSFHIRMYFASHHGLDQHLLFLTKKQQLFLYRNMLYLDNHSGKNHVFQKLIDILFTERNISVVNYIFNQRGSFDLTRRVEYVYNQRLLNSKDLVYRDFDYSLRDIGNKEIPLAPGNKKEYDFNYEHIDNRNKYSMYSTLLTKDLETILMDETDSVRYKLLDVLTDYWAYLAKHNQVNFLSDITDPITNVTSRLSAKDLFKFYVICLHAKSGVKLEEFPDYRIKRVFRPTQPTPQQIEKLFYEKRLEYIGYITDIQDNIPIYPTILTSFQFSEFITQVYRLNIGLWTLLSNYGDMDTEGQMRMAIDTMHMTEVYSFNDETVDAFLSRTGVGDPREYTPEVLTGYVFNILDTIFDNRLSFLNRLQKLQQALTDIFFNFNSYTVQLINNYYSGGHILAGIKDRRYGYSYKTKINMDVNAETTSLITATNFEPTNSTKVEESVGLDFQIGHDVSYKSESSLSILTGIYAEPAEASEFNLNLKSLSIHNSEGIVRNIAAPRVDFKTLGVEVMFSTPPDPSSDEVLTFLANNP